MKRYFFFLSAAFLIITTSCGKDKSQPQNTTMQLVTASAWKYDTAGIDADNNGVIDMALPAQFQFKACDRDNTITFQNNGTGVVDEGPTKCIAISPQTINFTWSFKNNESVINFTDTVFNGLTGDVTIKSITPTTLILSKAVDAGFPLPIPVLVHLKH